MSVVPASAGVFPQGDSPVRGVGSRPRQRGGVPAMAKLAPTARESSPPARGCSDRALALDPARHVVPASAGVFPRRVEQEARQRGRPRQRGGVPDARRSSHDRPWSSPPARGCSALFAAVASASVVVPASAGVFLLATYVPEIIERRPRQRGGVPQNPSRVRVRVRSSPPARGCSSRRSSPGSCRRVVPASAGVFLHATPRTTLPAGRPRQRGGVPTYASTCRASTPSSPPARGCSGGAGGVSVGVAVVPASAGVFLGQRVWSRWCSSRPRQRGGVPGSFPSPTSWCWSSPPARGCSASRVIDALNTDVVPASAGVFHGCRGTNRRDGGRPRQRGGVPVWSRCSTPSSQSSPPARGCSGGPLDARMYGFVVPASAGVFRIRVAALAPTVRRPRQRGGVPRCCARCGARGGSSPPARGCSRIATTYHAHKNVVPASAGVFRSRPGRPRLG